MFNLTGCDAALARDDLLIPSGLNQAGECTVVLPLYYLAIALFVFILFLVALIRTELVRRLIRKKPQSHSHRSGRRLVSPLLAVALSWSSLCVGVLLMFLPLGASPRNNSIIFLIGLQFALFDLLGERWLAKMTRLGAKIITSGSSSRKPAGEGQLHDDSTELEKSLEYLKHSDAVLAILHTILIAGIIFQFICMCILSLVFVEERIWLRIGVGMQGVNVFFNMCALIWQYNRCALAIRDSVKRVNKIAASPDGGPGQGHDAKSSVLAKFRLHQLIMLVSGCPASLIFVLWGFEVYPISYLVIVVTGFFDAFVNGGVVVTFVRKAARPGQAVSRGSMVNLPGPESPRRAPLSTKLSTLGVATRME